MTAYLVCKAREDPQVQWVFRVSVVPTGILEQLVCQAHRV